MIFQFPGEWHDQGIGGGLTEYNSATTNITCEIEVILVEFINYLKSFIIEFQFLSSQFEMSENNVEKYLSKIRLSVDYMDTYNRKIARMLRFATYMFETMNYTMKEVKKFDFWGTTDQYLLVSMLEINVGILGLCDAEGNLDYSKFGYSEKVVSYGKIVASWGEEFKHLNNVPLHIKALFEAQKNKAQEGLGALLRQIPNSM